VVHRDIKPDNIMFDEFGQCVVADFGIAKAASGQKLTGTGMSIGTPHYMSPEQARAQPIDGRSDIYSLGIVAYQCLVGEVPYDGEDSFAIGYKHIMEPIPVPSLATPEERRLFEIIRRMIMKDPKDRFQDADELIRALEGQPLVAGQPRVSPDRVNLANQPTTPIPSLQADAELVSEALDRTATRRPVGRRSAAREASERRSWGLWLVLGFVVLAGAGGLYAARRSGILRHAPTDTTLATAAAPVPGARTDSIGSHDSTAATGVHHDSVTQVGAAGAPLHRDSTAQAATRGVPAVRDTASAAAAAPVDSGSLRITGLPRGSSVMVDTRAAIDPVIRLPAGSHELAIVAPGFEFYKDTVVIAPREELVVTPDLTPFGSAIRPRERRASQAAVACEVPGPANRFGRACYDEPPRPVGGTRVPLPAGFEGSPSASVFVVRVSVEGRTTRLLSRVPSNDATFERLARAFVAGMRWTPAQRDGGAVDGWTQLVVQPDR
jgi:hypothetical protein